MQTPHVLQTALTLASPRRARVPQHSMSGSALHVWSRSSCSSFECALPGVGSSSAKYGRRPRMPCIRCEPIHRIVFHRKLAPDSRHSRNFSTPLHSNLFTPHHRRGTPLEDCGSLESQRVGWERELLVVLRGSSKIRCPKNTATVCLACAECFVKFDEIALGVTTEEIKEILHVQAKGFILCVLRRAL